MVLKRLKKGTIFSMKTSSKSMWILNENSEKFLGLNLKRTWCNFFSGLQNFMKLGQETYPYLVTNSTHGKEFEVQHRNFFT
jgi:hypothetical protein